jgi:hypothetical protein
MHVDRCNICIEPPFPISALAGFVPPPITARQCGHCHCHCLPRPPAALRPCMRRSTDRRTSRSRLCTGRARSPRFPCGRTSPPRRRRAPPGRRTGRGPCPHLGPSAPHSPARARARAARWARRYAGGEMARGQNGAGRVSTDSQTRSAALTALTARTARTFALRTASTTARYNVA